VSLQHTLAGMKRVKREDDADDVTHSDKRQRTSK
jgi:hypothetical protein